VAIAQNLALARSPLAEMKVPGSNIGGQSWPALECGSHGSHNTVSRRHYYHRAPQMAFTILLRELVSTVFLLVQTVFKSFLYIGGSLGPDCISGGTIGQSWASEAALAPESLVQSCPGLKELLLWAKG
jgi:hypothetical protein